MEITQFLYRLLDLFHHFYCDLSADLGLEAFGNQEGACSTHEVGSALWGGRWMGGFSLFWYYGSALGYLLFDTSFLISCAFYIEKLHFLLFLILLVRDSFLRWLHFNGNFDLLCKEGYFVKFVLMQKVLHLSCLFHLHCFFIWILALQIHRNRLLLKLLSLWSLFWDYLWLRLEVYGLFRDWDGFPILEGVFFSLKSVIC